jgi:HlyD family secretion protein
MDMRAMDMKIQDIVPEGTIVKEGDYVAQLDRSTYNNTLKTELDNLTTLQSSLQMKILDTAVVLTNLRDDIKNQVYVVEEAAIVLDQSKFEPPATIRKAEMNLDKSRRTLEQKKKGYSLKLAQSLSEINNQKLTLERRTRYVTDLEEYLAKFTITAPASGMVIYKKDRNGSKRKEGSSVNPFDMVIATLPDLTSMISKVYVSEIDVSKVKPGQKVNIVVDAFPKKPFTGSVQSIANVGEQLPNSDAKMFEVLIKVEGSDPALRPSMTTGNKIIIKTFSDAVYIPTECVQTGTDSIPYVYEKNRTKQIVKLGESNEKNVIIEKGLEPGTTIYLIPPSNPEKFKLVGENLISSIKETK